MRSREVWTGSSSESLRPKVEGRETARRDYCSAVYDAMQNILRMTGSADKKDLDRHVVECRRNWNNLEICLDKTWNAVRAVTASPDYSSESPALPETEDLSEYSSLL